LLLAEFNCAGYLDGMVHYFNVVLAIFFTHCAGLATHAFYSNGFFAFATMGSSAALANLAPITGFDSFAHLGLGMHLFPFSGPRFCRCLGEYGVSIVVAIFWFVRSENLLALLIQRNRAPTFKMVA
jgi:hypothetical protein